MEEVQVHNVNLNWDDLFISMIDFESALSKYYPRDTDQPTSIFSTLYARSKEFRPSYIMRRLQRLCNPSSDSIHIYNICEIMRAVKEDYRKNLWDQPFDKRIKQPKNQTDVILNEILDHFQIAWDHNKEVKKDQEAGEAFSNDRLSPTEEEENSSGSEDFDCGNDSLSSFLNPKNNAYDRKELQGSFNEMNIVAIGGFGDIGRYKINHAVKRLRKEKISVETNNDMKREIEIHRYLDKNDPLSLYVPKFIDTFLHDFFIGPATPILVMEYASGGTLSDFIEKASPSEKKQNFFPYFLHILNAIVYMHKQGVIHRDLKPENVLLFEQNGQLIPKISDFGLSFFKNEEDQSRLPCGTVGFRPKEVWLEEKQDEKIDVFSFTLMLLIYIRQLDSADVQYQHSVYLDMAHKRCRLQWNRDRYINNVKKRVLDSEKNELDISKIMGPNYIISMTCIFGLLNNTPGEQAKELIQRGLNFFPEKRPSSQELLDGFTAIEKGLSKPSPV